MSGKICSICSKAQAERFKPFCSARCADIDLNRWLKGSYAIPGKPAEEEGDSAPGNESGSGDDR